MNKPSPDIILKALRYDSLHEAEKLTGKSYKDDEGTSWLGMGLAMEHNAIKQDALAAVGDTLRRHGTVVARSPDARWL